MPITINDVRAVEEKRKQAKKEMYTKMYEQFSRKIKHCVDNNQKSVTLTIPQFILGYPRYDINAARRYMERQLRLSGFSVYQVGYDGIFVTWVKPNKTNTHRKPEPSGHQHVENDDDSISNLINLRKLANKYRA
mgnify:CR=1 FL=1